MRKQWITQSATTQVLQVNGKEAATLELLRGISAGQATVGMAGSTYHLHTSGFWQSRLTITDPTGITVLRLYPEKWYAHTYVVDVANNRYTLEVRNNPLAEYVIKSQESELLAYGLASDSNTLSVRIHTTGTPPVLLDCLLWYLFLPIATENMGDHIAFSLLMT